MNKQLSIQESQQLAELEATIERSANEVGKALLEIRDRRLYREEFASFEIYCRERWQVGDRHARRLIASAEAIENIRPKGPIPTYETVVRPLTGLQPEEQREAWKLATAVSSEPSA